MPSAVRGIFSSRMRPCPPIAIDQRPFLQTENKIRAPGETPALLRNSLGFACPLAQANSMPAPDVWSTSRAGPSGRRISSSTLLGGCCSQVYTYGLHLEFACTIFNYMAPHRRSQEATSMVD